MEVYLNGNFYKDDVAFPIANELSFLRGFAIFDFFPIRGGVPLFIEDYLDRFYNSAKLVGLIVPLNRNQLLADIKQLIHRNDIRKAYFKMILTGGDSPDGFKIGKPNLYIFPKKLIEHPEENYRLGVKLITDEFKREIPSVKTTNYMNAIMKIPQMEAAGAVEILYHDDGLIRECSRCNFFIVKKDKIATPGNEILKGITRKQILKVTEKNIELEVRDVRLDEIREAQEAFISSTTKLLFPVIQIDDIIIGDGKVGPITQKVLEQLKAHTAAYIMERS